jgi:hypothetical protein
MKTNQFVMGVECETEHVHHVCAIHLKRFIGTYAASSQADILVVRSGVDGASIAVRYCIRARLDGREITSARLHDGVICGLGTHAQEEYGHPRNQWYFHGQVKRVPFAA